MIRIQGFRNLILSNLQKISITIALNRGAVRCALSKKTSTGEWLKKFGEKALDSENVLYVCSSDCKKCDFNPTEKSCNGSQSIAIVYGAKLTVQVRDESDRDI